MNSAFRVVEKLEPERIATRIAGAMVALACVSIFAFVCFGVRTGALLGMTHSPFLSILIAFIALGAVAVFSVILTWFPVQHVFSFDRSSVYITANRNTARYSIIEVSVSAAPARLHFRGRTYPLELSDYERLAGFLRIVSYHPPRFKAVSAVKQTIIENSRPLRQIFTPRARNPTRSA